MQIKTDSALSSGHEIKVTFWDASADTQYGYIAIKFDSTIQYHLDKCITSSTYANFDKTPTTDVNKIWRITESADQKILYIHCNDELVLTYTYSSSSLGTCASTYGNDVGRIKFDNSGDTASDEYRIVGKIICFFLFFDAN